MGDISSVRSSIAPVLSRVKPSELKGPDMAELVGKLAELPRSDFDALSRAMLRDTFTGADLKEDAFKLVDNLRAWLYQPHVVQGNAVSVCGVVTFIYEMK